MDAKTASKLWPKYFLGLVLIALLVGCESSSTRTSDANTPPRPADPELAAALGSPYVNEAGDTVQRPIPTRPVEPEWPQSLVLNGESGRIIVFLVVNTDGSVSDVEVVESTHPIANQAVVEAVSQWEFSPGTVNGEAVATSYLLPFNFVFENRGDR